MKTKLKLKKSEKIQSKSREKTEQFSKDKEKIKYKSPSKAFYNLVNAFLSVLFFVSIYKLFIEKQYAGQGWVYFVVTLTTMITTGWLANLVSRIFTHYWRSHFTLHSFNQTLLHCVIYTALIVGGFITYIFEHFNLVYMCIILIIIKLSIFILTDYIMYNVQ